MPILSLFGLSEQSRNIDFIGFLDSRFSSLPGTRTVSRYAELPVHVPVRYIIVVSWDIRKLLNQRLNHQCLLVN